MLFCMSRAACVCVIDFGFFNSKAGFVLKCTHACGVTVMCGDVW